MAKVYDMNFSALNATESMKKETRWGSNNTVSANYSAILNGSGNTISNSYQYATISGCNITAVMGCAFHANEFVAQNMCCSTTCGSCAACPSAIPINQPTVPGIPTGAFYYFPIAGPGSPCAVFIK